MVLLGFLLFAAGLTAAAYVARWVLAPAARGKLALPRRFTLSDFLWLLILLQVVLAAISYIGTEELTFVPILVFGAGSVVALWTAAVHVLSKAGVARAPRRGVFILLLLPGVLVAILGTVWLVIFPFMILITYLHEGPSIGAAWVAAELIGLVILPAWCWGLHKLGHWAFRTEPPDAAEPLRDEGPATGSHKQVIGIASQEEIP